MRFLRSLAAGAAVLAACDSASGPVDPGSPARGEIVSGQAQTGTVARPLADSLRLRVVDADGRPAAGATVRFLVTAGGGSVGAPAVADAEGRAAAAWTLGPVARAPQSVQARADRQGGAQVILAEFTATARAGAPATFSLDRDSLDFVSYGDTARLRPTVRDAQGNVPDAAVTYASLDTAVATVDAQGLVRSRVRGAFRTTRVIARAGALADTVAVMARQDVAGVELTPATLVADALGDTLRIAARAVDALGETVEGRAFGWVGWWTGPEQVIRWQVENDSLRAMLVIPLRNGTGRMMAVTWTNTGRQLADTVVVTVRQVAARISTSALPALAPGQEADLAAHARAEDRRGHALDPQPALAWESSDPAVAVVENGRMRAVSAGAATLSVRAGPLSATLAVTVQPAP